MRKSAALILVLCILCVAILTGCTTENHRVVVTIKNNRGTSQNIEFHIDGNKKFSASLDPAESVEREFELSLGDHTFELYHEVEGTYELYKTETMNIESDSSLFFELE
jgi:outer membrane protein assembly factor BamA